MDHRAPGHGPAGIRGSPALGGPLLFSDPAGSFPLFHKPGQVRALATPKGLFLERRRSGKWRSVGGAAPVPVGLIQRAEDMLLLTRWALQNNRVVPGDR